MTLEGDGKYGVALCPKCHGTFSLLTYHLTVSCKRCGKSHAVKNLRGWAFPSHAVAQAVTSNLHTRIQAGDHVEDAIKATMKAMQSMEPLAGGTDFKPAGGYSASQG